MTRIVFSLPIGRSKTILMYLILLHSVAFLILLSLLGLSLSTLLLIPILAVSFIYYCGQYQWLNFDSAIINLERDESKQWYLISKIGSRTQAYQLQSCFVTPSLLMLQLKKDSIWSYKTVTLFSDAVDSELLRQLRVYCKHSKTFYEE